MRRISVRPDARAAHGDDADLPPVVIAELGAQVGARAELRRVRADDVIGELVVFGHPLAHPGQPVTEAQISDILRPADKDPAVAHLWVASTCPIISAL